MKSRTRLPHGFLGLVALSLAALAIPGGARSSGSPPFPYLDPARPLEERITDLLSRLTPEEKLSQMGDLAPAVPRLPLMTAYRWTNEALHGLSGVGATTVFPQSIGLGASFDPKLVQAVADAISTEGRARFHHPPPGCSIRGRLGTRCPGLTYYAPTINIARDPRWGRAQETYGEDPHLTSRMAVAYVRGLQGEDKATGALKAIAVPKHFAAHSGPDQGRRRFEPGRDAKGREEPGFRRDLEETYLPAFKAAVTEGRAGGVMCAYNKLFGKPACANRELLRGRLRDEWGFRGFVVTDCEAVPDMVAEHKWAPTPQRAWAAAIRAGTNLSCLLPERQPKAPGQPAMLTADGLAALVREGRIQEAEVDRALRELLRARFRLGLFDPPGTGPFARTEAAELDSPRHRELAREAARDSIVLLKNDRELLPLRGDLRRIAVIGPNAHQPRALPGSYSVSEARVVTPLQAIRAAAPGAQVSYARGLSDDAVAKARAAEVALVFLGLDYTLEDEGKDRARIELPAEQQRLVETLRAEAPGTPLVVVLLSGSALAVPRIDRQAQAILMAWYPGEEGGSAVADLLFGRDPRQPGRSFGPSARLPITFYQATSQLPDFKDYSLRGRTYRYFQGTPLYPFGYGLSYSGFRYSQPRLSEETIATDGAGAVLSVTIENVGGREASEVAQVYLRHALPADPTARPALVAFKKVRLRPGEATTVAFQLRPEDLSVVDASGARRIGPDTLRFYVGGRQPGFAPAHARAQVSNVVVAAARLAGPVRILRAAEKP